MLIRSNEIEPNEFIDLINNEEIIVYEDVQASKIWVNYVNGNWLIRPKNLNQNPLNLIDLAVQKYYKYAYAYLLSLPDEVTNLLRPNHYYCFEYFPDQQPANIKYTKIPKNHLILTCICKYKKHYTYNIDEIKTFAKLFDVDTLPIIYKGKLNEKQLEAINYFLHTNKKDLSLFLKEKTFAGFFYKLLNPNLNNSFLNNEFVDNLEKMIIRFTKSNKEYTCEILNPLYTKMELKTDSEYADVYSLLLFNFLQFLYTIDINNINIDGNSRELIYINLMCKLYNMYIEKYKQNIIDFKFNTPDFFSADKFKINTKLIKNETTKEYINQHNKLEYLLKIVLSSFQKQHKKTIGIINEITLNHLNDMIKKINIKIEEQLNFNNKLNKFTYQLKDLKNYQNITWEEDRKGYVYPEIGSILKSYSDDKKHKKIKYK